MFAAFRSARRKASHLAIAAALVAGGVAVAPAASAQEFSEGFVAVYQPAAQLAQGETPNYQAIRPMLAQIQAAAQTPDDKYQAGNITLITGQNLQDDALRRQGLEMMLASGKTAPDRVADFNYYVANFAFNAGDYAAARQALNAALAAGYNDGDGDARNDPEFIILQSYFNEEDAAGGIQYLNQLNSQGKATPTMLLLGLQNAYDNELVSEAQDLSLLVLAQDPSERNWTNALRIYHQLNDLSPDVMTDTIRLMRDVGATVERQELSRLVDNLDARIMGAEVVRVLDAGRAAGLYEASDPYFTETRGVAESRAAVDRRETAQLTAEGNRGSATDAFTSANVLYSLENYAEAERLYQRALDNGYGNADHARLRVGMAQVKQGNYDAAIANFDQVGGEAEALAAFWAAYARQLAG